MLLRRPVALLLASLISAAAISSVADAQQAATGAARRGTTFDAPVSGIGAYLAGNDQGLAFSLPLVRTDSTYDTIVHVANASGTPTTVTITLHDHGGAAHPPFVAPLGGWASLDYDPQVDPNIGPGFSGSATVASAHSPVVVTGEVLNQATQDDLDSYQEVPGSSTFPVGDPNHPHVAYLPLLPSCYCGYATVNPTLYLHNTSAVNATAKLSFYWTNPPSGTPSPSPVVTAVAVTALGETTVSVGQVAGIVNNNFDAATLVESTQPLSIAADLNANGGEFWAAAPTSSETGTTFYLPRFEYRSGGSNRWITGLVLLNVATQPQTFTVSVYDPDGRLALRLPIANVPPMGVGKFNYGGVNDNLDLPDGFVGSAIVTSQANAVAWSAKYNGNQSAISIYFTPPAPPKGSVVVVPSVRKNAVVIHRQPGSTASTAIAIQNPEDKSATYVISFRDSTGALAYSQTVTFPPRAAWYVSQAADAALHAGFQGSAQIANASGGALPIVVAEVAGGVYAPPATLPLPTFHTFLPDVPRNAR